MKTTNTNTSATPTATTKYQPEWMQYVPQGSYLLTSSEVNILIQGTNTCLVFRFLIQRAWLRVLKIFQTTMVN